MVISMVDVEKKPFRTLDARKTVETMIKPAELIDVVELTPLTLNDRRIYNVLIGNAWGNIDRPVIHTIPKKDLRVGRKDNKRVGESIERLMGGIVKFEVIRDGKREIKRVQLLGANTEQEDDTGTFRYEFPLELREILLDSKIFARLKYEIMYALSSKYALALYEMVEKRGNMDKDKEDFPLDSLRGHLGVPSDKYAAWGNLRERVLEPACKEVSALSNFHVTFSPIKTRQRVTSVCMTWKKKSSDGVEGVINELSHSKVGRKARIDGSVIVAELASSFSVPDNEPSPYRESSSFVSESAMEAGRRIVRDSGTGLDFYSIEQEFYDYVDAKGPPRNFNDAFIGFVKAKVG